MNLSDFTFDTDKLICRACGDLPLAVESDHQMPTLTDWVRSASLHDAREHPRFVFSL